MVAAERSVIKPQKGYQTRFCSSSADIVIGGGAAGAGKTFALLLEFLRHTDNPEFGGIIFRKTCPQITNQGGLWDESNKLYSQLAYAPSPTQGNLTWNWMSGAKLRFSHLQHSKNMYDWQGAQIPFIGWDELTHFSEDEFFYLLSRNRSICGVKPYTRATCNPQTHGWVKDIIGWWLYPDDYEIETLQGYPIPERSGKVRYFFKTDDTVTWGDSKLEVIQSCSVFKDRGFLLNLKENEINPYDLIKSITFIGGDIYENKQLLRANPEYLSNLHALPEDEKLKLLGGCWKAKDDADILFDYSALVDMYSNDFVQEGGGRYLTADIAMEGSDNFVLRAWEGWRNVETKSIPKSGGPEVVKEITEMAKKWKVPQSNIAFDADGVGAFLHGYFPNAISFHNGGAAIKQKDDKQDFENIKTQCTWIVADKVNNRQIFSVSDSTRNQTIKECYAARKLPHDGIKIRMTRKDEMKKRLQGLSPDYFDSLIMRAVFELVQPKKQPMPMHGGK
jgi:hypothetical protein